MEYVELNGGIKFFSLDRRHFFWTNMIQKIKIVSLSLYFVPRLIRICRSQW